MVTTGAGPLQAARMWLWRWTRPPRLLVWTPRIPGILVSLFHRRRQMRIAKA